MFSLRVFNNNPSSPSAAPPLWKPVTSGASGNQPRPWYIDYPQPQPSSSCPAVLSSMLSLSSGAAGQQQDFGLPLTNKTPQLLTACKIRSRARSTTHARTQTHTNRHTEIYTHTDFAYTSPRLPRLLETNTLTVGGPLPLSYLEPALGDTVHVCGGTSQLHAAQKPLESFDGYCFCRRFIFGRSECRSRAEAGSSHPPPPPPPPPPLSRQRGSRTPGQWGDGEGGGGGPGRPGAALTLDVSKTNGSPAARLITGLPK